MRNDADASELLAPASISGSGTVALILAHQPLRGYPFLPAATNNGALIRAADIDPPSLEVAHKAREKFDRLQDGKK